MPEDRNEFERKRKITWKKKLAMICDVEHKVIAMSSFFKGQLFLLLNLMISQKQQ